MDKGLQRAFAVIAGLSFLIGAGIVTVQSRMFGFGFIAGSCWGILNLVLVFGLLHSLLVQQTPERSLIFILIKFPVLYGIGFYLLFTKTFPIVSLLAGFTFVIFGVGILYACLNKS